MPFKFKLRKNSNSPDDEIKTTIRWSQKTHDWWIRAAANQGVSLTRYMDRIAESDGTWPPRKRPQRKTSSSNGSDDCP